MSLLFWRRETDDIRELLAKEVGHYVRLARANNYVLWFIYVAAVTASVLSSFAAATGNLSGVRLTILTAVPAGVVLINSVFRFDERTKWLRQKRDRLRALLRLSVAQAISPANLAEQWNHIDAEMAATRPALKPLPATPTSSESPPER